MPMCVCLPVCLRMIFCGTPPPSLHPPLPPPPPALPPAPPPAPAPPPP